MKYDHSILEVLSSGQWVKALRRAGFGPGLLVAGALVAASGLLGACSGVPDAVNPVAWWDGLFGDDEPQQAESVKAAPKGAPKAAAAQTAQNQPPAGADQPYPALQTVPEKPVTSTVEQRRQVMQDLSADRANARSADESARAAENAPAAAPGAPAAPAAPSKPGVLELTPELGAADLPPPPAPAKPGRKSYLSGVDTGPAPAAEPSPPAPPPAQEAAAAPAGKAPPAAKGEAVTPLPPGSSELSKVYEAKLRESAPTVTTAPVGPTGGPGAAPGTVAEGPAAPGMPAASPGTVVLGNEAAPSVEVFDGAISGGGGFSGAPGQLGTVYFKSGSAELDESDVAKLRDVVAAYQQRGGNIRIVGHASSFTLDMDPVHHQMANFNISVRRADAVASALIKLGVKPANIFVNARSDTDPVYYESMPAGRAGNQRAEIFIDY